MSPAEKNKFIWRFGASHRLQFIIQYFESTGTGYTMYGAQNEQFTRLLVVRQIKILESVNTWARANDEFE